MATKGGGQTPPAAEGSASNASGEAAQGAARDRRLVGSTPRWAQQDASSGSSSSSQVGASAKQDVSIQGLGAETTETEAQMVAFHNANPNITVKRPLIPSPTANTAYQHLCGLWPARGHGRDPTAICGDVRQGWLDPAPLNRPNMSQFFSAQANTVHYNGHIYGVPWFTNAEGLYYRTDLAKTPPTTPQQLVSDAQAAVKANPGLKEGLALRASSTRAR